MKKISKALAQVALHAAKKAGNNASIMGLHQPKEPKSLKTNRK